MKYSKYSVVIIGSGIAGLYAALKSEQQLDLEDGLLLMTKTRLGECNSLYAQGGMVAVMNENSTDSVASHVTDTIKAGAGLSELSSVKFISENSDNVVKDLLKLGVEFDTDENDKLCFTKEAAHSVNRILHAGGDATGKMIEQALCEKIIQNENIQVYEQTLAVELLINSNSKCRGVIVYNDETQEYETIYSNCVILATGGAGQLYKYTTNPKCATGDGLALAYRAGAILQDMEFFQFHPTALAIDSGENRFLISEAVRGEGAKLVDIDGQEFMHKYHEKKELAPRDIVTRANFNEMIENNCNNVYLNASCIEHSKLIKRFPNISKKCLEFDINIIKDFIPVAPAAHYFMGGVKTNLRGETSISGLFAIGEVASTGLHGGNRLASNSLLECVVCAYSVADFLKSFEIVVPKQVDEDIKNIIDEYADEDLILEEFDVLDLKNRLQDLMWNNVGILRSEKSLMRAFDLINSIKKEVLRERKCISQEEYELKNMLIVAELMINSALNRQESRGAHYRLDYPEMNSEGLHSCISKYEGKFDFVK
ncbi:MAG: L-aspartate oxidase [Candidatus Gastranaerophilales bacterium]